MFSCILDQINPAVVSIRDIFKNFWTSVKQYIYIYTFFTEIKPYIQNSIISCYILCYYAALPWWFACSVQYYVCVIVCSDFTVNSQVPPFVWLPLNHKRPDYFSTHLPESLLDPPKTCWRKHFWGFCPVFTTITLSKHNHFHMFTCTHTQ